MRFDRITTPSRLIQHGEVHGLAVCDFNGDGFDELYLTAYGGNAFWHNCGDGTFSDVTEATGTKVLKWSTCAAFGDLNGDGFLDLYVTNFLEASDETPRLCPNSASPDGYVQCSPAIFEDVGDVLFIMLTA